MRTVWTIALVALALTCSHQSAAQDRVLLIRHAEKETTGSDPALTDVGRQRAVDWSVMLKDAGIDAVYSSEFTRTRMTAGIIADTLGIPRHEHPAADAIGLIDLLGFDHEGETVLVVGHTDTIPRLLAQYGVDQVMAIPEDRFDNLFFVVPSQEGPPVFVHFRMP